MNIFKWIIFSISIICGLVINGLIYSAETSLSDPRVFIYFLIFVIGPWALYGIIRFLKYTNLKKESQKNGEELTITKDKKIVIGLCITFIAYGILIMISHNLNNYIHAVLYILAAAKMLENKKAGWLIGLLSLIFTITSSLTSTYMFMLAGRTLGYQTIAMLFTIPAVQAIFAITGIILLNKSEVKEIFKTKDSSTI